MKRKGEAKLRVKRIDEVRYEGNGTYHVEATMVEDDRPRKGGDRHDVSGHWEIRKGKRVYVQDHDAKNPRR
jgi:hypothetical protein